MKLNEKYERPCFAECSKCGEHGAIIFEDGSQSENILSIEGGKRILKNLVSSGKITPDDADRIEDHLICSDLMDTDEECLGKTLLSVVNSAIEKAEEEYRSSPMWN